MPAAPDEIVQGEAEGILIHPSKTAVGILSESGKVMGVQFLDVESFCFDEERNLELEIVEDSYQTMEADAVIVAVGQEPEIPEGFGLDLSSSGFVELDPYTFQTSKEGVFASGDAVEGAGSLIEAIASGRKSAIAIDNYLGGSGVIDKTLAPQSDPPKNIGSIHGFAAMQRTKESSAPVEQRIQSFCKVVQSMSDDAAARESLRCLQCDLRLKIRTVKSWGSY
jgi:hypothetical protein